VSTQEDLFGIGVGKGDVIFRQGDVGDTKYINQSGSVEISQEKDGKKTVLALLERGDFFGEMALIDGHLRSATATAISPSRLLPFTRASIMDRIRQDPGVVLHLLSTLCQRITEINHRLRTMVQKDQALRSFVTEAGRIHRGEDEAVAGETPAEGPAGPAAHTTADVRTHPEPPERTEDITLPRAECVYFEDKQPVSYQGDPGDTMYIIVEGAVEISQGPRDDRTILAVLRPGDFFGETAMIVDQPRTAHAIAVGDAYLFPLSRHEFIEQIQTRPELALYILRGLIIRLRGLLSVMNDPTKSLSVPARVLPPPLRRRGLVKTALVSLATCGGCAAILLENQTTLAELLASIDISCCPMLIDEETPGEWTSRSSTAWCGSKTTRRKSGRCGQKPDTSSRGERARRSGASPLTPTSTNWKSCSKNPMGMRKIHSPTACPAGAVSIGQPIRKRRANCGSCGVPVK